MSRTHKFRTPGNQSTSKKTTKNIPHTVTWLIDDKPQPRNPRNAKHIAQTTIPWFPTSKRSRPHPKVLGIHTTHNINSATGLLPTPNRMQVSPVPATSEAPIRMWPPSLAVATHPALAIFAPRMQIQLARHRGSPIGSIPGPIWHRQSSRGLMPSGVEGSLSLPRSQRAQASLSSISVPVLYSPEWNTYTIIYTYITRLHGSSPIEGEAGCLYFIRCCVRIIRFRMYSTLGWRENQMERPGERRVWSSV